MLLLCVLLFVFCCHLVLLSLFVAIYISSWLFDRLFSCVVVWSFCFIWYYSLSWKGSYLLSTTTTAAAATITTTAATTTTTATTTVAVSNGEVPRSARRPSTCSRCAYFRLSVKLVVVILLVVCFVLLNTVVVIVFFVVVLVVIVFLLLLLFWLLLLLLLLLIVLDLDLIVLVFIVVDDLFLQCALQWLCDYFVICYLSFFILFPLTITITSVTITTITTMTTWHQLQ